MDSDKSQRNRYWTRFGATRRHTYYLPANNLPGILLFGLIGLAGLALACVAAWHLWKGMDTRRDWWLVGIGLGLAWLAIVQGRKLA